MIRVFVLYSISLGCGFAQPTTNQCTSDDNTHQVALIEQVLGVLQTMDRRQQSMESRQQSMESRQQSMENRQQSMENRLQSMEDRLDEIKTGE